MWLVNKLYFKLSEMTKSKRLSPKESREIALEAAKTLLIETGPQAVTLKAVSNRIGKTHANLLHHFGSASGLQKELATYLSKSVCDNIGIALTKMHEGELPARDLADMIFDAFNRDGAGALASWMLLTGNEDALNPIVEVIHDLVDQIIQSNNEFKENDSTLRKDTLQLVLLSMGDALLGAPLAASLGLPRDAAREIAVSILDQKFKVTE